MRALSPVQRGIFIAVTVAAIIIGSYALQHAIDNERNAIGLSHQKFETGSLTGIEFMGGLRTALAAFLWIKVDRIHDNYYGSFEREQELIPLYRIVTWLNPHIDEAYYVGSYMLYKFGKLEEAIRFNEEGMKMNPESGNLELNAAQFELARHNDLKSAARHFERALLRTLEADEKLFALQYLHTIYRKLNMNDKALEVEVQIASFKNIQEQEDIKSEHRQDH